ncbi:MAG TPA: PKD domain-containing protein [Bacteroidia bacterium]|nr:PKD domain-containing protein [Bacteroidia bacterium]
MKKTIYIIMALMFTASISKAQTGCHAMFGSHQTANTLTVNFTDSSTSPHTIISWLWNFGDGTTSTLQNPSHTYVHDSTYYVCLTIHDDHGCSNTVCHHITVNPIVQTGCHAMFGFHQTANSLTVHFSDSSTSSYNIVSWAWNFGDGSTSTAQNPIHTYAQGGTYNVCLTITDSHGCHNTFCHHITVTAPNVCHASFSFNNTTLGNTIHFINTSTGSTPNTTYLWTFGDGTNSTDVNPVHAYAHNGVNMICLYMTDTTTGCSSHYCRQIHHSANHHPHWYPHHAALIPIATLRASETDAVTLDNQEYIVNYPNPVVSSSTIQYELADDADVKIEIYDILGNRISQIINEKETAGLHTQRISADNYTAGFYLIKMSVGEESFMKKIAVSK